MRIFRENSQNKQFDEKIKPVCYTLVSCLEKYEKLGPKTVQSLIGDSQKFNQKKDSSIHNIFQLN